MRHYLLYVIFFITGIGVVFAWALYDHFHVAANNENEFESAHAVQTLLATSSLSAVRVPILIYHSVRPDYRGATQQQKTFNVPPDVLDRQLAYLHDHGYTVISMDQLAADIQNGTTSTITKPVVLTFDDGWKSQYIYALPLLKKYHDTATFYIYTKPTGVYPHFMTWDEIRVLQQSGMTIGDHTMTHPYLSHLSPAQLQNEIMSAKHILEQHLGVPVTHFASPFGYTSPQLVALLQTDGFETGRTTYKGARHSKNDLLRLTAFIVGRNMRDFIWLIQHAP